MPPEADPYNLAYLHALGPHYYPAIAFDTMDAFLYCPTEKSTKDKICERISAARTAFVWAVNNFFLKVSFLETFFFSFSHFSICRYWIFLSNFFLFVALHDCGERVISRASKMSFKRHIASKLKVYRKVFIRQNLIGLHDRKLMITQWPKNSRNEMLISVDWCANGTDPLISSARCLCK